MLDSAAITTAHESIIPAADAPAIVPGPGHEPALPFAQAFDRTPDATRAIPPAQSERAVSADSPVVPSIQHGLADAVQPAEAVAIAETHTTIPLAVGTEARPEVPSRWAQTETGLLIRIDAAQLVEPAPDPEFLVYDAPAVEFPPSLAQLLHDRIGSRHGADSNLAIEELQVAIPTDGIPDLGTLELPGPPEVATQRLESQQSPQPTVDVLLSLDSVSLHPDDVIDADQLPNLLLANHAVEAFGDTTVPPSSPAPLNLPAEPELALTPRENPPVTTTPVAFVDASPPLIQARVVTESVFPDEAVPDARQILAPLPSLVSIESLRRTFVVPVASTDEQAVHLENVGTPGSLAPQSDVRGNSSVPDEADLIIPRGRFVINPQPVQERSSNVELSAVPHEPTPEPSDSFHSPQRPRQAVPEVIAPDRPREAAAATTAQPAVTRETRPIQPSAEHAPGFTPDRGEAQAIVRAAVDASIASATNHQQSQVPHRNAQELNSDSESGSQPASLANDLETSDLSSIVNSPTRAANEQEDAEAGAPSEPASLRAHSRRVEPFGQATNPRVGPRNASEVSTAPPLFVRPINLVANASDIQAGVPPDFSAEGSSAAPHDALIEAGAENPQPSEAGSDAHLGHPADVPATTVPSTTRDPQATVAIPEYQPGRSRPELNPSTPVTSTSATTRVSEVSESESAHDTSIRSTDGEGGLENPSAITSPGPAGSSESRPTISTDGLTRSLPGPAATLDAQQVVSAIHRAFAGSQRLRVQLDPPELGPMIVDIMQVGANLIARLELSTPAAHQAVMENLPDLQRSLTQNGIRVDRFDVQYSNSARESSGQRDRSGNREGRQPEERPQQQTPQRQPRRERQPRQRFSR